MFVGHSAIAFIIIASITYYTTRDKQLSILLGSFSAIFATLPDVDIIAGVTIFLLNFATEQIGANPTGFWSLTNIAHRGVTHSHIVLLPAVAIISVLLYKPRFGDIYTIILIIFSPLLILFHTTNFVSLTTFYLILASVAIVSRLYRKYNYHNELIISGLFGLFIHPYTDFFTGVPPEVLWPVYIFDFNMLYLSSPVIHLILVGIIESVSIVFALTFYIWLAEREYHLKHLTLSFGGLVASVVPFLTTHPTVENSYQFVYSTILIGLIIGITWYVYNYSTYERYTRVAHLVLLTMCSVTISFTGYLILYSVVP